MKIKLNESKLKQIVGESVKRVLNETISTDYRESLKQLLTKAFTNLNDNEKQFLYDLLSNEPWETIYTALVTLKPYNPSSVNESVKKVLREGKTINNKPFFKRGNRYMKPGEELYGSYLESNKFLRQKGYKNFHDAFAAVMRGELDKTTFDKWYDEHMKAVNKHNDRLEYNWDEGNYDDYNYKTLAVSDYDDVNY